MWVTLKVSLLSNLIVSELKESSYFRRRNDNSFFASAFSKLNSITICSWGPLYQVTTNTWTLWAPDYCSKWMNERESQTRAGIKYIGIIFFMKYRVKLVNSDRFTIILLLNILNYILTEFICKKETISGGILTYFLLQFKITRYSY